MEVHIERVWKEMITSKANHLFFFVVCLNLSLPVLVILVLIVEVSADIIFVIFQWQSSKSSTKFSYAKRLERTGEVCC